MSRARTRAQSPPLDLHALAAWLRRIRATAAGPVWMGFAITAAYLLIFLSFYNLTGILSGLTVVSSLGGRALAGRPLFSVPGWWGEVVNAVLIGYLPAAAAVVRRGALRDLHDLRPLLRLSDAGFRGLCEATVSASRPWQWLAGCVGVLGGVCLTAFDPGVWGGGRHPPLLSPEFLFTSARNALVVWLFARIGLLEFGLTRAYARLGRTSVEVDLLDLRPLAPFSRKGLRTALVWLFGSSIFSLYWLGPTPARTNLPSLVLLTLAVVAAFVLPLRGVHRRILVAKAAELDALRSEIRALRQAATGDGNAGAAAGSRLAGLVAYRALIESVREWPLDVSTLLRFVAFALLGVGSWFGGALVERIVDAVLG